jgi:hypothetical protein
MSADTDTSTELVPPKLSSEPVTPDDASDLALLFELDGTPYYIAKNPPASAVLRYMRSAREQGDSYAMQELLENLIGADNYRALEACPTLTMEQWGVITSIAAKYTIGLFQTATAASGNSSGG